MGTRGFLSHPRSVFQLDPPFTFLPRPRATESVFESEGAQNWPWMTDGGRRQEKNSTGREK